MNDAPFVYAGEWYYTTGKTGVKIGTDEPTAEFESESGARVWRNEVTGEIAEE